MIPSRSTTIKGKTVKEAMANARQLYGDDVVVLNVERVGSIYAVEVANEKLLTKPQSTGREPHETVLNEKLDALLGAIQKIAPHELVTELKREPKLNNEIRDFLYELGFRDPLLISLEKKALELGRGQMVKESAIKSLEAHLLLSGEPHSFESGLCALVGPTGSGKTTTIAKFVSTALQKYAPHEVGLITTDFYRVGAYEQLRMYGDLMGIPVKPIKEESELGSVLNEYGSKKVVYIDTIGAAREDEKNDQQMKVLLEHGVNCAMTIQASLNPSSVGLNIERWKSLGVKQAILTKWDEVDDFAGLVQTLIVKKMPVRWMTNGQRVPKDLHKIMPLLLAHKTASKKR